MKQLIRVRLLLIKISNALIVLRTLYKQWCYFGNINSIVGFHYTVEIKFPENITIGKNFRIGALSTLGAYGKIIIGDNVTISKGVVIETAGLDIYNTTNSRHISNKIEIGNNVWIGANSVILGGVIIGDNSVIGAGTIVTKSIPAYSIVVGSSGKVIKNIGEYYDQKNT